jgi:hypothetical protein
LLALRAPIDLLAKKEERFLLTPLAEDYMLPSSPNYYGWSFDAWRQSTADCDGDAVAEGNVSAQSTEKMIYPALCGSTGRENAPFERRWKHVDQNRLNLADRGC